MLTHDEISSAVEKAAKQYPIKKASYFGSYADGQAKSTSDLDLLIELDLPRVSLIMLSSIKIELEELLKIQVDVIRAPLPPNALIEPQKMVHVYG